MKPAEVRFYFDADVLGLAKLLVQVRPDVTYPGHLGDPIVHKRVRPPCPITEPGTRDDIWIPVVAEAGWLIVTRDTNIRRRPKEIGAVRASSARMVVLATAAARGTWHQLELIMRNWRKIEGLLDLPGPFIYECLLGGLKHVDLDDP